GGRVRLQRRRPRVCRRPMKRIAREQALVYGLDASLEPALRVDAGEPFAIETEDASSGHLTSGELPPTPENTPYVAYAPAKANPVGGPVSVGGVLVADRVKVEIHEDELAPYSAGYNQTRCSPLGEARDWHRVRMEFLAGR